MFPAYFSKWLGLALRFVHSIRDMLCDPRQFNIRRATYLVRDHPFADRFHEWDQTEDVRFMNANFPQWRIAGIVPGVPEENLFLEVAYTYEGKKYRCVFSQDKHAVWPPYSGNFMFSPRVFCGQLTVDGHVRDVTGTLFKYMGPTGDFHGGAYPWTLLFRNCETPPRELRLLTTHGEFVLDADALKEPVKTFYERLYGSGGAGETDRAAGGDGSNAEST